MTSIPKPEFSVFVEEIIHMHSHALPREFYLGSKEWLSIGDENCKGY